MKNDEYTKILAKYTNTVKISTKISKDLGGRQVEDRLVWASVFFTKMCVTSVTILIIAPDNMVATKAIPHWDFSSIFSLSRNFIECYQAFFYLCVDQISTDEYNARRLLFDLHDYHSKRILSSFINYNYSDTSIEEQIRISLENTEYFNRLDGRQQKHFLKGDTAFFITREDIEQRMGNDKNQYKMIYKLFSSNTHTFPMAFYKMAVDDRGRGVKTSTEVRYHIFALDVTEQYLRRAVNEILTLFPETKSKLTSNEISTIIS